ncbi:Spermidine N(1)-acetyltransferase [Fundidesulfovibrio magnetotacticus]|uniref:Spermidine N(1)-acetyltransferase n=1 Tax=Fundidesulfovibrio magnetotacticus TaxID=2730080 RepID=A0A6V8LYH9_9BACT|nr:GNAT family protein [Fundidesulfovibrio magnetotacticus]GFK94856.1 Spermidine N(1)-acetyltransferase [Fundidesulfovibrio magnetotacticus]
MVNYSGLQGRDIFLRGVELSDVGERYRGWLNDPRVNRFLESRFVPRSLENIRDFVQSMDGGETSILYAICLKEDGRHIGNIKLGPINHIHRFADVGLLIGEPDCWGKGIGSQAIGLVTDHAFLELNLNKLLAGCYAGNVGSMKAFQKVGYRQEAHFAKMRFSQGAYEDEYVLALLREDWEAARLG